MTDWRWVTQVSSPTTHSVLQPTEHGMWIDFEGLDSIMPMQPTVHSPARTRLGWLTHSGWHYLFVAEQIDPTQLSEANNNPQEES